MKVGKELDNIFEILINLFVREAIVLLKSKISVLRMTLLKECKALPSFSFDL